MSSDRFAAPLQLKLSRSPLIAVWLVTLHAAALLVVMQLPLPYWLAVAAAVGLAVSAAHTLRRYAFLVGPRAVSELIWESDDGWVLIGADGSRSQARLQGDSYWHRALVILNFAVDGGGKRAVVLLPGNVDASTFRMLRVRLRVFSLRAPQFG